jgi:hypothetical protein
MSRQKTPARRPVPSALAHASLAAKPVRLAPLLGREHALEEAVAEALDGALDAADVDEIVADAENHCGVAILLRPRSIAARMLRIVASRPEKTASPTR